MDSSKEEPVAEKTLSDFVIFHCTPRTLEAVIVADNMAKAIPESDMYTGQEAILYGNFELFMGMTADIEFVDLAESPAQIKGLQFFWESFKRSHGQWALLWKLFRQYVTLAVHDLWLDSLIAAQSQTKLFGPREIWPSAPEFDEEEDPKGPKSSSA